MDALRVELGERSYDVRVERDFDGLGQALSARFRPGPAWVISNPVVADLHLGAVLASLRGAGFAGRALLVPDGEAHKNLESWSRLVQALLSLGVERGTPILALGGGVTGDLAGFAAATTLRGLPLVQLPTTLLAMVDSAVGGKVGVNTVYGKNLVGAFYQPQLVWAAISCLATLPRVERAAGLAEVIKLGVIADAAFFCALEERASALAAGDPGALAWAVRESCRIKAAVVGQDEREGGRRAILNFGHTVGHAIETAAGHGRLRHGACVAVGMVAECQEAVARGLVDSSLLDRLVALLLRVGLPTVAPPLPRAALLDASMMDKKRAHGIVHVPFPVQPGLAEMFALMPQEVERLLDRVPGTAAAPLED